MAEHDDSASEDDPAAIRSIALSPDDAVDAFIYSQENPGEAVLRVTPPFHGRMRARLHVYRVDDTELTGAVHLSPSAIIANDLIDAYPDLESTLDAENSTEADRIRERHADAVDDWRARARDGIVDSVALETDDGTHRVELKPLG
ncbi:hypothetical protein [Natrinema ejinorense]|uniref:DUF8009 domain-containing protein n=1 Tax=Natrinema ejinorense TaxID=373386 RepID=A0A2A5QW64_9EURY|nr:hypothetical protein [Natrinema ejinorense]PCR90989.1 hypothetical protein CP557_10910 [Natrinema ejinorense]